MTARLTYEEQLVLEEAANIVLALRRAEPRILPDEEDATLLRQATDKLRRFITTPWPTMSSPHRVTKPQGEIAMTRWTPFVGLALVAALAVGCATPVINLRHPDGRTAQCGRSYHWGYTGNMSSVEQDRACVNDYQVQGYQRVP